MHFYSGQLMQFYSGVDTRGWTMNLPPMAYVTSDWH
jgi:hypothetical protein